MTKDEEYHKAYETAERICREYGLSGDEFTRLSEGGHLHCFWDDDGYGDISLKPSAYDEIRAIRADRNRRHERRFAPSKPAETTAREQSSGVEPWMVFAAILFPIWIPLWLIWEMIKALNPFTDPMAEPVDAADDGWSYAEREQKQWLYGTGRYANRD